MRKSYNQIFREHNCYGIIYKAKNGRYIYQNDNDMGFVFQDLAEFGYLKATILRKIKCGKGYIYQLRNQKGCVPDDDSATPFKTTIALLHECHDYRDPLSKHEQMLCKRYWDFVWGK